MPGAVIPRRIRAIDHGRNLLHLAFGAIANAVVFSAITLLLIARRIRIADRALASGAIDPCHAAIPFPKTCHSANESGVKQ